MACRYFEESIYCKRCINPNCIIKGGDTNPHDMCGCSTCEFYIHTHFCDATCFIEDFDSDLCYDERR